MEAAAVVVEVTVTKMKDMPVGAMPVAAIAVVVHQHMEAVKDVRNTSI